MKHDAGLAQLAEQKSSKLWVGGSSPPLGTILSTVLLSLALAFPGAAVAAKQSPQAEKSSSQASKAKVKKAAVPRKAAKAARAAKATKAKPAAKSRASKVKAKPDTAVSAQKAKKLQSKAKSEPVVQERLSKKSRSSRGDTIPVIEKRPPVEAATPVEPKRAVALEKATPPVRIEQGCSGENGTLVPVGQVMKSAGKTFRCQKTWDFTEGKLVGYPAWVELFMPTPGWGAGLKETPRPPAGAVQTVPGAKAKPAPVADKPAAEKSDIEVKAEDDDLPTSVKNEMY